MIERVTAAVVQREAVVGDDIEMDQFERIIRHMAAEDRFDRRVLSGAILDRARRAVGASIGSILPSQANPDLAYVLLIKDHDVREPYETYREARRAEALLRVQAAAVALPDKAVVIGLALDAPNDRGGSEDFIYLEAGAATTEERAAWAQMREDLGYFIEGRVEQNRVIEDEYPEL